MAIVDDRNKQCTIDLLLVILDKLRSHLKDHTFCEGIVVLQENVIISTCFYLHVFLRNIIFIRRSNPDCSTSYFGRPYLTSMEFMHSAMVARTQIFGQYHTMGDYPW